MSLVESLINLRYGITKGSVLNPERRGTRLAGSVDPDRLGEILIELKSQAVGRSADGLDYATLARSETHRTYRRYLLELRSFDPGDLIVRERQLAFWINLYNGLVLDAVIQWRIMRSVLELPGFFWRAGYNIGGLRFSANDIENGVLRGNAAHPALPGPTFGRGDPRRAFSMVPIDPRVHFALVCASRSCPPVGFYTPARVHEQLDQAARSFVQGGGVKIDAARNRITLSRIFQWYAPDFGAHRFALGDKHELLTFVAAYLSREDRRRLAEGGRWDVAFMRYDWRLNGLWSPDNG